MPKPENSLSDFPQIGLTQQKTLLSIIRHSLEQACGIALETAGTEAPTAPKQARTTATAAPNPGEPDAPAAPKPAEPEAPTAAASLQAEHSLQQVLNLRCGLFVTLRTPRGDALELRGCIGRLMTDVPLGRSLPEVSRDAAFRDRRFPPLEAHELNRLRIELSLLSPMWPVTGPEDIEIGRHGIYLQSGGRSAVFLPEVPVEQGWDLHTTLTRLCLKGGMAADAWKGADMSFQVFTSRHFGEAL